jgi:hypothetical protein
MAGPTVRLPPRGHTPGRTPSDGLLLATSLRSPAEHRIDSASRFCRDARFPTLSNPTSPLLPIRIPFLSRPPALALAICAAEVRAYGSASYPYPPTRPATSAGSTHSSPSQPSNLGLDDLAQQNITQSTHVKTMPLPAPHQAPAICGLGTHLSCIPPNPPDPPNPGRIPRHAPMPPIAPCARRGAGKRCLASSTRHDLFYAAFGTPRGT